MHTCMPTPAQTCTRMDVLGFQDSKREEVAPISALVSDLTVRYVRPILATKRFGVTVGDAYLSDGQVLRFRVQSRDPLTVQLPGGGLLKHRSVLEAWLIRQREVVPM